MPRLQLDKWILLLCGAHVGNVTTATITSATCLQVPVSTYIPILTSERLN